MFAILPVLALAALFVLIHGRVPSLRQTTMITLVLWGLIVTALTEGLSLFHALTMPVLVVAWTVITISVCAAIFVRGGKLPFAEIRAVARRTPLSLGLIFAGLVIVIGLTGMVALLAAPNTWDAMAYHMPRVFFWEQWHTVAPFPTHTLRQLYQPPFAEFVMLHFQILSGGDGLSNIGQWAALLFSAMGVSKIAAHLRADARGQMLAAVLCVTLPIGIMQATGPKNDFVTALWVVCLAEMVIGNWFLVFGSEGKATPSPDLSPVDGGEEHPGGRRRYPEPIHTENVAGHSLQAKPHQFPSPPAGQGTGVGFAVKHAQSHALLIGSAAGLALFTKGTAYVYIAPLLVWWAVILLRRSNGRYSRAIMAIITAGIVALLINAGHFARNLSVFGTPLTAPSHSVYYANETFAPAVLVSNTLRNLALHVYIPDQINERVNIGGTIYGLIERVHQAIGIDLNDPRTTFPFNTFEIPPIWQIFNEDRAGNPIHLGLLALAMLAYPFLRKTRHTPLTIYLLVGIVQFLLFSWLLKWQVWGTRLQLPFFVYIAAFTGTVLAALLHRYLSTLLSLGLLFLALFWIFNTSTRPIFATDDRNPLSLSFYIGDDNIQYPSILTQSRLSQYFNSKYELEAPSRAVAEQIKPLECNDIGLISDESGILYPLMMLLKADNPAVFIQHVDVDNETAFLSNQPPYAAFAPCAIVFMYGAQPHLPENADIDGRFYTRIWTGDGFEIYVPAMSYTP